MIVMNNILENFLPSASIFVKLYVMALLFTAFMSLIVLSSTEFRIAAGMFLVVAFLSLIPLLGVHSYCKGYKGLFYFISIFCLILWILSSLICLFNGLSHLSFLLAIVLIGAPFLLVRLLFNEPLDSYFLVLSCFGGLFAINIIAVWFWSTSFHC